MENRGYSEMTINRAIDRARGIPCSLALRRVLKRQNDKRPVFALTYPGKTMEIHGWPGPLPK